MYADLRGQRGVCWSTRTHSNIQEGRIYIEKINGPFLCGDEGTPAEFSAGLKLATARGWLGIA
jgi:hypothetical protein